MCTLVLEAGKVTISAAMGFPSRSIPIPTGKPSCMLWEKDWSLEESHALYLKGSSDEAPVRYASSPLPNRDCDCASVLGEEIKRCWCEEGAVVPSQSVLQKACPSSHNTLRSHKNTLKQMFPWKLHLFHSALNPVYSITRQRQIPFWHVLYVWEGKQSDLHITLEQNDDTKLQSNETTKQRGDGKTSPQPPCHSITAIWPHLENTERALSLVICTQRGHWVI